MVIVGLVLVCFFLRALPRLWLRNAVVSDTYFHLYCAATIRENFFRLPDRLPRVMLNHAYTYPFLYHYLLACFPLKQRLWVERLTGAFFDTLSLILIYLFSQWAVQRLGDDHIHHLPNLLAALYAFSPALLRIGSGPRAYNGSPRVMGQTLYLLHLMAAYHAYTTHNVVSLIISLVSGAALIVTAKFGNQVFFFFGIFFSVFISYQCVLLLGGSLLTALVFSNGRAWRAIQGQIRHSLFYVKYLQAVFLFASVRTSRLYLRSLLAAMGRALRFRIRTAMEWYYGESYFLHLLLTVYPQFILLCFIIRDIGSNPFDRFLLIWTGAGFFWFLATKYRRLLFLGEGERYLEYALFPSLFLAVKYLLKDFETVIDAFLAYSVLSAFYYVWQYSSQFGRIEKDIEKTEAIFAELNRLPAGVIMPIGSFHFQALYRSHFPILTYGGNIDERLLSREEFMLVYGNYPYPSEHFDQIRKKYGVSYIISDPAGLKHYCDRIIKQPEELQRSMDILGESSSLVAARVLK